MKNFNGIDLLKFIMSIIIVGVHSCVFETLANDYWEVFIKNISNVCVPTFFVISSFFFFRKMRSLKNTKEKNKQLVMFEKRTLFLYLFWIVVQLPYIIYLRKYSFPYLGLSMIKDIFLGETFIASWFLGAMIVGMPIVYIINRNRLGIIALIISLIYVYLHTYNMLPESWQQPYLWYRAHVGSLILSFWGGMFWMMLGYYCSSDKFVRVIVKIPQFVTLFLLVSILLLTPICPIEYISIPLTVLVFAIFYSMPLKDSVVYKQLRAYSIIIYCIHGTVLAATSFLFHPNIIMLPIVTVLICIIIAVVVCKLSMNPRFKFLQLAY